MPLSTSKSKIFAGLLLTFAVLGAARVLAIDASEIELESVSGSGWRADGIKARIDLSGGGVQLDLNVARLHVEGLTEDLRGVRLVCPDLQLALEAFSCSQASARASLPFLGPQEFRMAAKYWRRTGVLDLDLDGLTIANGAARVNAQLRAEQWSLGIDLKQTSVEALLRLASALPFLSPVKTFSGKGLVDADIKARGTGTTVTSVRWQLDGRGLNVNNAAGSLATDTLSLRSSGNAERQSSLWRFQFELQAPAGQAYAEPLFLDLSKHALTAAARGEWRDSGELAFERFELTQKAALRGSGSALLSLNAAPLVRALNLNLAELELPGAYTSYAQPFLLDTSFKALNTSGSLSGQISVTNSMPTRIDLDLRGLNVEDGSASLALKELNGELHWTGDESNSSDSHQRSRIEWRSGSLLGLSLGASALELEAWGTNLRVAEPTRIPIFNGALALDAFRIRKLGTPQMAFMLDAAIEPINVAQLCRAFGWPEFGGELSGKITKLRLEEGVLTLGATLNAQIFSGAAAISEMRMEGVFSQWPRFQADIRFEQLDLEQLTQAFSFGRITGKLSGEIERLRLFNWEPVAFDAHLYTPEDDRSRHRISQRAVQNIGSLGGSGAGVAAALQGGLLKFFEDFNYDRLGLSCRLENEVCAMTGVAPAANGAYYLVKGKGLPRIDVIGNATRVDWPRMLAQLKAATESSGPVVK